MSEPNRRLAPGSALVIVVLAHAACTSTHDRHSTETGNPPVIDRARVGLRVVEEELHVTGERGAVMPGGITIEVTVVSRGETARGPVAVDGSFDVVVDASPEDELELRAIAGQRSSEPVHIGGDDPAGGPDAGLSCQQRTDMAWQRIAAAAEAADVVCDVDEDCTAVSLASVCNDGCAPQIVSLVGQAEVASAVQSIEAELCATFEQDGCAVVPSPCPTLPEGSAVCLDSQCQLGANAAARAMLEASRNAFEQLAAAAADGDVYWYEEENCLVNADGGSVSVVQVDATGARIVQERAIERTQCLGALNRYENFVARSLPELHDDCTMLLARHDGAELELDDRGVVRSCTYDGRLDGCQDDCGEGFLIRTWDFGTTPP